MRYFISILALFVTIGFANAATDNPLNRSTEQLKQLEASLRGVQSGDFIITAEINPTYPALPILDEVDFFKHPWIGADYIYVFPGGNWPNKVEIVEYLESYQTCCEVFVVPKAKMGAYMQKIYEAVMSRP